MSRIADERGATAVLVVVLMPLLLAALGLGASVGVLAATERQLANTARSAALASAANLPLFDLGALDGIPGVDASVSVGIDADGDGVTDTVDIDDLFPDAPRATTVACPVAETNLRQAPFVQAFTADRSDGACGGSPLQAPAVVQVATGPDAQTETLVELQSLVDQLAGALPAPSLTNRVNLLALLPAIAHPQVEVTVTSDIQAPLQALVDPNVHSDLSASATARRVLKNAVLLPSSALDCHVDVPVTLLLLGSIILPIDASLDDMVERDLDAVVERTVLDALAAAGILLDDATLDSIVASAIEQVDAAITDLVFHTANFVGHHCGLSDQLVGDPNTVADQLGDCALHTLYTAGLRDCPITPIVEPTVDVDFSVSVDGTTLDDCVLSRLRYDLQSLYDPPPDSTHAPTAQGIAGAVLDEAAASDSDVLAIVVGATDATTIPILDAIPVAADSIRAGQPLDVTYGRGLFRATMVEESPLGDAGGPPLC